MTQQVSEDQTEFLLAKALDYRLISAPMNIVLFANHDLAIPSLNNLIEKEMLAGLVMPSVQQDSNLKMQTIATNNKVPFISVDKNTLRTTLPSWLEDKRPDAIFVMTFAYILPEVILKLPKYGCFNWHTGILPGYRGPDPVFWEILNGEEYGGITLHRMNAKLDEGDIIKIEKIPLMDNQTHGEHYRMMEPVFLSLCDHMIDMLVIDPSGVEATPQDASAAKYYKDPELSDLYITWQKSDSRQIKRLTLAANPTYGGARTFYKDTTLHVFELSMLNDRDAGNAEAGTIISAGPDEGLVVATSDNVAMKIDNIYCKEGFYSGRRFAEVYDINAGDRFDDAKK